jgi:uncharacterized membrane protein
MKRMREYTTVYMIGAVSYSVLEILWRGFTHWTMAITGGICFLIFHVANIRITRLRLWGRCLVGCIIITIIEFLAGCTINKILHLNVWDYSGYPFNLWGQICLGYSALWFFLGIPMCCMSSKIAYRFNRRMNVGFTSLHIMKDQN